MRHTTALRTCFLQLLGNRHYSSQYAHHESCFCMPWCLVPDEATAQGDLSDPLEVLKPALFLTFCHWAFADSSRPFPPPGPERLVIQAHASRTGPHVGICTMTSVLRHAFVFHCLSFLILLKGCQQECNPITRVLNHFFSVIHLPERRAAPAAEFQLRAGQQFLRGPSYCLSFPAVVSLLPLSGRACSWSLSPIWLQ